MERKSWVLVGFFSSSTCSFAFAGRSVLRDSRSSLTPALRRSTKPTDLPFFPFPLFSSGIGVLPIFGGLTTRDLLREGGGALRCTQDKQAPPLQTMHMVTPAKMIPDH